jgi:hypothetical protein
MRYRRALAGSRRHRLTSHFRSRPATLDVRLQH